MLTEGLPPEEAAKVAEMFSDLGDFKKELFQDNEDIRELVTTPEKRFKTISYGPIKFRVKSGISLKERNRLNKLKKEIELEENESEETDEKNLFLSQIPYYEFIARMSIDKPYTDPRTWAVIDEEIGEVAQILLVMSQRLTDIEEKIKKFR